MTERLTKEHRYYQGLHSHSMDGRWVKRGMYVNVLFIANLMQPYENVMVAFEIKESVSNPFRTLPIKEFLANYQQIYKG